MNRASAPLLITLLVVAAVVAAGGWLISNAVDTGTGAGDVGEALDLAEDVSGGDADEGDSLFVAENLEPALAEVADRVGADATVDIKIEQRSLKLQAQPSGGGSSVTIAVGASGNALETPLGSFEVRGVPLSAIDPAAVEEIAAQVASEAGVAIQDIGYFTTLPTADVPTWGVYLDDGRRWEAGVDGSNLRQTA